MTWQTRAHRRLNPLTGEWVLVSPHRMERPWQGEVSPSDRPARPAYDPSCYLCPGNARAGGARNPQYEGTYVFDNDFPALLAGTPPETYSDGPLQAQGESGLCRVICFSPRHDLDVAQMTQPQVRLVVDAWAQQYAELGSLPSIDAVTIFENRGAMMGASNPHPHCQVWAQSSVPNELHKETLAQREYFAQTACCLLCEYVSREAAAGERLVFENEHVLALVPFWATWPFETMVLPRRHLPAIDALAGEERDALAQALHDVTARYDRLFSAPFPYSMGVHQQPTDGAPHASWHAHAHYYPPLLRSASVRKFMVGYEMLAQPQRDITPEDAARRLREA